jgi:hypothetical protein
MMRCSFFPLARSEDGSGWQFEISSSFRVAEAEARNGAMAIKIAAEGRSGAAGSASDCREATGGAFVGFMTESAPGAIPCLRLELPPPAEKHRPVMSNLTAPGMTRTTFDA